jgi:pyruvate dehydrogenase E2 component (dihydrolipoamide acetyltransferase)
MPVEVLAPPLGGTVDTLTLVAWYRQEGELVRKDEPLFSVETDKATLDVEAPASGILRLVSAAPGAEVTALSRIAVIAAPDEVLEEEPSPELPSFSKQPASDLGPSPSGRRGVAEGRGEALPDRSRIFISPRARRLAEDNGLEWAGLPPTGPEGAIVERDVRAALQERGWDGDGAIAAPMTGVRAVVAARMLESARSTAPVTLTTETDATALVEWRRRLAAEGSAVSYNDLFLALLGRALPEHPQLNASFKEGLIRTGGGVHVGLAVDAERGLLVPVVRDVDRKSLAEIAEETAALVEAARQGRLSPEAMRGGTFTLTNLGMFGIDAFTPIINLPECAILGVGRIKAQPSVVGDEIRIRQKLWLSLTFDHRLVDGGPAARFLQRVAALIEEPEGALRNGWAGAGANSGAA